MVNRVVKLARSRFYSGLKGVRVKGKWRSTSIGILLFGISACGSLDDIIIEPEMSDLQLTVDTSNLIARCPANN